MTTTPSFNMAPIKTRQNLTERNLHMLNHLVSEGRHPQSIFTATASWERSSWSTSRLPMDRRMELVKGRVLWSMRRLLQIRPEGPDVLRKKGVCLRGQRVLLRGTRSTQLQSYEFWKRLADELYKSIEELERAGSEPILPSASCSGDTGVMLPNEQRMRWAQSKELIENWILAGMHPISESRLKLTYTSASRGTASR